MSDNKAMVIFLSVLIISIASCTAIGDYSRHKFHACPAVGKSESQQEKSSA